LEGTERVEGLPRNHPLYFWWWNLPNAWQIGLNPTITYDHRAPSGDQWNVPIGLFGSKTIMVGKTPGPKA
jgi:hypothetical protein